MNEIKIYMKQSGSIAELYKDFNLYKGCYRNTQISVYVPKSLLYNEEGFTNAIKTGAIITAPNGVRITTQSYFAEYVKDITIAGIEYSVFTQIMPKIYAEYSGTQTIVINVVSIDENSEAPAIVSVTTSQTAQLVVLQSAYLNDDQPIDPSQTEQIEGKINSIALRVTKNESDIGKNQQDIEVLEEKVADFSDYQNRMIKFFPSLPAEGSEEYIYAVVSTSTNAVFDLYVWENGEWVYLGGANIQTSTTVTYSRTLFSAIWSAKTQTIQIDGMTDENIVTVTPADAYAAQYVEASITLQQSGDTLTFTAENVPSADIPLTIRVATEVDAPQSDSGGYTKAEANSLFGASLSLNINNSTYVLTAKLVSVDGTVLSTQTIDLPIESMVVMASYDSETKSIVLTLQSGETITVPVGDLVSGLASQTALDAETAARTAADTALRQSISQETSARQSADTAIGTRIDNIENGNTPAGKATAADAATRAQQDGEGNVINSTYATKAEVSAKYTKPSSGIPESDLSQAVQNKLNAADEGLTNAELIVRADTLPEANANSPDFVQVGETLYQKIITGEAYTVNVGDTFYFSDVIAGTDDSGFSDPSVGGSERFGFTSNGNTYYGIWINNEGGYNYLRYYESETGEGSNTVFDALGGWTNQAYRTVTFTEKHTFAENFWNVLNGYGDFTLADPLAYTYVEMGGEPPVVSTELVNLGTLSASGSLTAEQVQQIGLSTVGVTARAIVGGVTRYYERVSIQGTTALLVATDTAALHVITVNMSTNAYTLSDVPLGGNTPAIPTPTVQDAGKVLSVNSAGEYALVDGGGVTTEANSAGGTTYTIKTIGGN